MRVLLIDDDPFTLRSLARWFQREDHVVLVSSSVEMALETWGRIGLDEKDEDVGLIVTDYHLGDGTTAADLPLLEEGAPPFILSTASPQDVPEPLREAALGILAKPFDVARLRKLVVEVSG